MSDEPIEQLSGQHLDPLGQKLLQRHVRKVEEENAMLRRLNAGLGKDRDLAWQEIAKLRNDVIGKALASLKDHDIFAAVALLEAEYLRAMLNEQAPQKASET